MNCFFRHIRSLGVLMLAFSSLSLHAAEVTSVRLSHDVDRTRIVFDMSATVSYHLFRIHQPERIVIDMKQTQLAKGAVDLSLPNTMVKSIRHGMHAGVLRIVVDVNDQHVAMNSFVLKATKKNPSRLVLDLTSSDNKASQAPQKMVLQKELVIAVDAGHGGEDPGAIGPRGLQEKEVTLGIAKKMVDILNRERGVRAFLTRKNDYFVPLKKRVRLVREAHADLMISIHADAVDTRSVKGSSVYTLAERGATPDRVALALAAKENAADEMGGIKSSHDEVEDEMVRNILGDMAKRDSLNSSQILAESMLLKLGDVSELKYSVPKRAQFVVLSALEIPSVLVEVDFISNPRQERKLRGDTYQSKLADALSQASLSFIQRMGMLAQLN